MGFRGVDVEKEDDGDDAPEWGWRNYVAWRYYVFWWRYVSWRRFAILVLYLAALVGAGAILARTVSTEAGAALVVAGLVVLVVMAFKSSNRAGDSGMDPTGGVYAGSGEWNVGDGGGGGGD